MEGYSSTITDPTKTLSRYVIEPLPMETKSIPLGAMRSRVLTTYKEFLKEVASKENCEDMKKRLQFQNSALRALTNLSQQDDEYRLELIEHNLGTIKTLDTAINKVEQKPVVINMPAAEQSTLPENKWDRYVECTTRRWKHIVDLKHRKSITDPNTLEGYMRTIQGIVGMGFHEFMDKYGPEIMRKFFPVKASEIDTDEQLLKYTDKCTVKIADKYTLIQLTGTIEPMIYVEDRRIEVHSDDEVKYVANEQEDEYNGESLFNFVINEGLMETEEQRYMAHVNEYEESVRIKVANEVMERV